MTHILLMGIGSFGFIFVFNYFYNYLYNNKNIVLYKFVYLFSSLQIFCQQRIFPKKQIISQKEEYCYFDCVNDISVVELCELKSNLENNINTIKKSSQLSKYNMIVYKDKKNMVCFYSPFTDVTLNYETSNVSIVSLVVVVDNVEHQIKLSSTNHNFYIVNNVINKEFIKYYFNHILHKTMFDTTEYHMVVVDENIQFTTLEKEDEIIIQKDNFTIVRCKTKN